MVFEFNPALWFYCGKCLLAFPNTDELKQHKLEIHLGDCLGVKCILFEEILILDHQPSSWISGSCIKNEFSTPVPSSSFSSSPSSSSTASAPKLTTLPSTKSKFKINIKPSTKSKKFYNPYVGLKRLTPQQIKSALTCNSTNSFPNTEAENKPLTKPKPKPEPQINPNTLPPFKVKQEACVLPNSNNVSIPETVLVIPTEDSAQKESESPPDFLALVAEDLGVKLEPEPEPTSSSLSFTGGSDSGSNFDPLDEPMTTNVDEENERNPSLSLNIKNNMEMDFNTGSYRISCKLCRTQLRTPEQTKNHEQNCFLHNKDRHIFCITCQKEFKNPVKLNKHLFKHQNQISESQIIQDSDDDDDDDNDNDNENGNEDLLPIGPWIVRRRKKFLDLILLSPEPQPQHMGECRARCLLCSQNLKTTDEIKYHVKTCWAFNKDQHCFCLLCKKSLREPQRLKSHNEELHPFKLPTLPFFYCTQCFQEFETLEKLKEHEDSAWVFFTEMKGVEEGMVPEDLEDEDQVQLIDQGASSSSSSSSSRLINDSHAPSSLRTTTTTIKPNKKTIRENDIMLLSPLTCRLCRTKLCSVSEVLIHKDNCWKHNKARHVFCLGCRLEFQDPLKLKRHQDENQSQCGLLTFPEDTNWSEKIIVKDEDKTEIKLKCGIDLDPNLPLGRWILQHREKFPDVILLDPDPTTEENLLQPKPICRLKPTLCKLCGRKLTSVSEIKIHVQTCWAYFKNRHRYCIPCKNTFTRPTTLQKHCQRFHPYKFSSIPPFFCIQCYDEFSSLQELRAHVRYAEEFYSLAVEQIEKKEEI